MIYTITLNPAIDVIYKLRDSYRVGKINRAYDETLKAGGKGINVSRVLKTLGLESIALGLVGGITGEIIESSLKKENIKTDFVHINSNTRIDTKVFFQNGNTPEETQINAPGPIITQEDIMNLAKKLAKIKKGDIVIISGGIPKSLSLNLFDNFLKYLSSRDAYIGVDLFAAPLLKAIRYKPFLVSINQEELADTLYTQVKSEDDCIKGANRLLKMGAKNVIILRGANGAIFVNEEITIKVKAFKGEVVNTVGGGDSVLAGFTDEFIKTRDYVKAIKKGVLVGSATAFSDGLADAKTIAKLMKQINK